MTRRVDPARSKIAHQQVTDAEHVQGQIVVTVVVAMKESVLLLPVRRRVRGVKIQNQPPDRGATPRNRSHPS